MSDLSALKTYRVVFAGDTPPRIVRAAEMESTQDQVTFLTNGLVVARFQRADVAGVAEQP